MGHSLGVPSPLVLLHYKSKIRCYRCLSVVFAVRDLQLDINQCLKSMGSGPIEEESSSGHKEHHSAEFAGTRPLYTKLASS